METVFLDRDLDWHVFGKHCSFEFLKSVIDNQNADEYFWQLVSLSFAHPEQLLADKDISQKISLDSLGQNPHLTGEIVIANIDKKWDYYNTLSLNPNIWKAVVEYPKKMWNWYELSHACTIPQYILEKNLGKGWVWNYLSGDARISAEFIQANLDKPWWFKILSYNPKLTWEIVSSNLDKDWDWRNLSMNSSITWEIVSSNLDKPCLRQRWDWRELSSNPNITEEIIQANPDKPWDWYVLSRWNPNITHSDLSKTIPLSVSHCQWKKFFEKIRLQVN
jgi:hypothetical protein